ncbi:MAG: ligase 1 [Candidatus Woesearchaeota archaeon]|nr:ligase 1 [Candidatus Woesearchaeota archaeon]
MEFRQFAELCSSLEKTSSRLKKTFILSEFFKKVDGEEAGISSLIILGDWFPGVSKNKIGISDRLVIKAISRSFGISESRIESLWREKGDLGDVAAHFSSKREQATLFKKRLDLKEVFETIRSIAYAGGEGSISDKIGRLSKLITNASPIETRYIVRAVLGEIRTGVAESIIIDALNWAYLPKVAGEPGQSGAFLICPNCNNLVPSMLECISCGHPLKGIKIDDWFKNQNQYDAIELTFEEFREKSKKLTSKTIIKSPDASKIIKEIKEKLNFALYVRNNIKEVAESVFSKGMEGLESFDIEVMKPFRSMLYIKAGSLKEALDALGPTVQAEYKYDGFRMQIHKKGDMVKLFTRNQEDVTAQFPDVVELIKGLDIESCVLDTEVVGITKTGKFKPFQSISQRIKRKYNIYELANQIPVEVNVFDILYYNGKSTIHLPFKERRRIIEEIIKPVKGKIRPAVAIVSSDLEELDKFYKECLNKGLEGVMIKALDKPYSPGRSVGYGMKVKPVMETLDVAITRAEWGEGKRKGLLTSYYIAVKDNFNSLKEIGKVSTGLKELKESGTTYSEITKELLKHKIKEEGRIVFVEPTIVIEVDYEEIQKSPSYSSGFALRFPRFVRLRPDKGIDDVSPISLVRQLYEIQRGKGKGINQ